MNTGVLLAGNRAEEYGLDIWGNFVIPPYFKDLSLLQTRKPMIIIGGRGCGKTMLLRYLCYETQFSAKRESFGTEVTNRIGLYWKIDTQFAKTMSRKDSDDINWSNVFIHMGALELGLNIINSLIRLKESKFNVPEKECLLNVKFDELKGFDTSIPSNILEIREYLKVSLQKLQTWIGNYKKNPIPTLFPLTFLTSMISIIRDQINFLKNTDFFVYIDEYENLLPIQKKVVNTWIKHSETPLIFNVAMKRNGFDIRKTVGNESIVNIHDYREFDIEKLLDEHHVIFASEILFLRLKRADSGLDGIIPIDIENLFKTNDNIIEYRKSQEYKKIVTSQAMKIFPGKSQKQLAEDIIQNSKLREKLHKLIKDALYRRGSNFTYEDFYDPTFPEASVLNFALLNRKYISDNELLIEFNNLKNGISNKYTNKTGWIHNNTIGCILYIYSKLGRLCPFYAGFDSFCSMSRGNIRHFLELCFQSIAHYGDDFFLSHSVPIKEQSSAAKQVSSSMLNEIKSLGNKGNTLYTFVIRLGTIFEYCRNNPSQSEPEQNHFVITDNISSESNEFLSELEKWSVLYIDKITKVKGDEFGVEYILNPIYSYYFNISYRKKRRIMLNGSDFQRIAFGDLNDFTRVLNRFNKDIDDTPTLFDLFS